MKLIEYFGSAPEETLALDELLLIKAESGDAIETLRFWESREYFVVVGRGGKVSEDCYLDRCRRDGIKVLRRISGGGTVLQGPGCLNYSAVLSYESDKAFRDVRHSYRKILKGISDIFKTEGVNVNFFPLSDLALDGKKVSGNAQARKKKYFLHHGTFLYDFDFEKTAYYLKHPVKEPEYRRGRAHGDFLANMPLSVEQLEEVVRKAFPTLSGVWELENEEKDILRKISLCKYSSNEWNYVF